LPPVSAVLIALDEEARIERALRSVAFCDEVLVVDAGSSDRTREIAAACGARVIVNAPFPGFTEQRRLATAEARHDWVLAVDADEEVGEELGAELRGLLGGEPACAAYAMPRVAFYLGSFVRATDWYPDPQVRLFDRRRAGWEGGRVHESVKTAGEVGRLRGELLHRPYAGVSDHLRRIDRYTSLWAEDAWERGVRATWFRLWATPAWNLFRNYALRGGFRLGRAGLAISLLNALYTFLKFAKLLERERRG
jgi:glycosyltransferase involved in cell wall biosynthesis